MNDMATPDRASKTPLVWIDCEMTGLDPAVDELVEVAVIVTDSTLHPLAEGIDLVIRPSDASLAQMSDFVVDMHRASGLSEVISEGISLEEAEKVVLAYIQELVPQPGVAQLAGNSIAQDQRFLRKYMPAVTDYLHYRLVDVSTIKELAKRWYPRVYVCAPGKNGSHRALADIQDSIVELEYYRRALFPTELDPVSGAYHRLADQVVADARATFPGYAEDQPEDSK